MIYKITLAKTSVWLSARILRPAFVQLMVVNSMVVNGSNIAERSITIRQDLKM